MAFLNDSENRRIQQAIEAAETQIDGELVTIIASVSDTYRYVPTMWAGLITLLAPWLMLLVAPAISLVEALIIQSAVFLGVLLLCHWQPVKMALIPQALKRQRASRLAREQFFHRGLYRTPNHNTVLLFVSVAERYVEIVADQGIGDRVAEACWRDIVAAFTDRVSQGHIAEGFLVAIGECARRMAEHYPATGAKANVLADRLIEI
jgi:putative membrane protein